MCVWVVKHCADYWFMQMWKFRNKQFTISWLYLSWLLLFVSSYICWFNKSQNHSLDCVKQMSWMQNIKTCSFTFQFWLGTCHPQAFIWQLETLKLFNIYMFMKSVNCLWQITSMQTCSARPQPTTKEINHRKLKGCLWQVNRQVKVKPLFPYVNLSQVSCHLEYMPHKNPQFDPYKWTLHFLPIQKGF